MAFSVKHNGTDITDKLDLTRCLLYDRYGGTLDNISLAFPPDSNTIAFDKNDEIEVKSDYYSSGKMYVDDCGSIENLFTINAVSCKPMNKKRVSKMWASVSLQLLANDVAGQCGLGVKFYGVTNRIYESVYQDSETDLQFLKRICAREGLSVKIENGSLIVFSEYEIENNPEKTMKLTPDDISNDWDFSRSINGLNQVTVSCFDFASGSMIEYTAKDNAVDGGSKHYKERVRDVAEAERFAKGYLRQANKEYVTGILTMPAKSNISACTVLELSGFTDWDGKYVVYEVEHDVVLSRTNIKVRQVLTY